MFLLLKFLVLNFRVLDSHYAPILVSACEKFRYDYIHGLQREWATLFLLQWRNTWVEDALQQTMDRCVHLLIFQFFTLLTPLTPFFRGLDYLISRVDDEDVNDVDFKSDLVMQDIRPIGGLSRVVLSTIMEQAWIPYEWKCLLFCFSTNPTEDEVHHAFARFPASVMSTYFNCKLVQVDSSLA